MKYYIVTNKPIPHLEYKNKQYALSEKLFLERNTNFQVLGSVIDKDGDEIIYVKNQLS